MALALFGTLPSNTGSTVSDFFNSANFGPLAIIDLLLVAGILYWLYTILKDTRALGIIYGILFVVIFFLLAKFLQLELLAFLFANLLTLLFVAIPVLFQPELRRALEHLGRTPFGRLKGWKDETRKRTVDAVSGAATVLSQNNAGALIVIKRSSGLGDLATSGTKIDGIISTALLLNLFYDRSPLHDGAVIIDDDRIMAAGAMLPLSEREYGYTLGARHRAAVGLTEQSDAVVVVVSEEKGIISLVVGGKITPGIEPSVLNQVLTEFLSRKRPQEVIKKFRRKAKRNGSRKPSTGRKRASKTKGDKG
ncbi:TIGR00159 family protein [Patescibacteria group bacterium]|nr:TIGR00159 family protein [Patescibacteria group bacterium]